MNRALAIAGSLLLCAPLLLVALIVSGSTGSSEPVVFALAAMSLVVASAWVARWWWYAALPGLAFFLVLASTALDTTVVETEAELRAARFGLPFDIVEAQLSANPPLPYTVGWNPWEDPARLLRAGLLASYALVLGTLGGLVLVTHLTRRRRT